MKIEQSNILRGFDEDLRKGLAAEMTKRGITLRFETQITSIERAGDSFGAKLTSGETGSPLALVQSIDA